MIERIRSKKLATGLAVLAGSLGTCACGQSGSRHHQDIKNEAALRSVIMPPAQKIAKRVIRLVADPHLTSNTQKTIKSSPKGIEVKLTYEGPAQVVGSRPDISVVDIDVVTADFKNTKDNRLSEKALQQVTVSDYSYEYGVSEGPITDITTLYALSVKHNGQSEWAAVNKFQGYPLPNTLTTDGGNIEAAQTIVGLAIADFNAAAQDFTAS